MPRRGGVEGIAVGRLRRQRGIVLPVILCLLFPSAAGLGQNLTLQRPPPENRKFRSTVIDEYLQSLFPRFKDPDLAVLFSNCLPNTLDTTVFHTNDTDTFIITGDIPAMWMRDSAFQVMPYMKFTKQDPALKKMICGLINRQAYSLVHVHPYANAFNFNDSDPTQGHQGDQVHPPMNAGVWEGKYELDSLAAFLRLSRIYYQETGDISCFLYAGPAPAAASTPAAAASVPDASAHSSSSTPSSSSSSSSSSSVVEEKKGEVKGKDEGEEGKKKLKEGDEEQIERGREVGGESLNAMVSMELKGVGRMILGGGWEGGREGEREGLGRRCMAMGEEIGTAVEEEGVIWVKRRKGGSKGNVDVVEEEEEEEGSGDEGRGGGGGGGVGGGCPMGDVESIYAYEVDGFGSSFLGDDAGIPSLLSLPYLGYCPPSLPLYQRTRAFALSSRNSYYYVGREGGGEGGAHLGAGWIWPMGLIVRGLTAEGGKEGGEEVMEVLEMLMRSSAGTGFVHEAFWKDDVTVYTRPWFSWVNGLFAELVMKIIEERPALILKE
ncbi:Hypothetical protein NocV09_02401060 [Nannochloropsis oceanica]